MLFYHELMYDFELSRLKEILGQDVVNNLNEWDITSDEKWSKKKIIEMIYCLHGNNILKNKEVIEELLYCLPYQELSDFCKQYYPSLSGETQQAVCKKIVDNWKNNEESLALLKFLGIENNIFKNDSVETIETITKTNSTDRFYELFDYQFYIKQQALNILNSNKTLARLLIHMPTGTGKTKTAMHIIIHYINFILRKQGLIIWIAHTKELLQQAYDTFIKTWKHLGDEEITVYRIWANNTINDTTSQLSGIMFCGLQKLMALKNSNLSLYNRLVTDCRLLIFDEAHKAAADETRKILESFMIKKDSMENRFLMGLTATPGRTTEYSPENTKLANMFENRIISINSNIVARMNMGNQEASNTEIEKNIIKYFQNRKILSVMKQERLEYTEIFSDEELKVLQRNLRSDDYTKEQLEILAKNKERNKVILQKLRFLYSERKPTIIFACSVLHAKMISAMLTIDGIPNCVVFGDMSAYEREKAIESFKDKNNPCNLIINYDVLTTGFDSTNIQCVFITRPTKSIVLYSQMLGRGLRGPLMGGQEECLLVDVKDNLESFDNNETFSYFDSYWNK